MRPGRLMNGAGQGLPDGAVLLQNFLSLRNFVMHSLPVLKSPSHA